MQLGRRQTYWTELANSQKTLKVPSSFHDQGKPWGRQAAWDAISSLLRSEAVKSEKAAAAQASRNHRLACCDWPSRRQVSCRYQQGRAASGSSAWAALRQPAALQSSASTGM